MIPRCFSAAAVLLVTVASAHPQNYSIDWHTIDGGGGTSTGGAYSISGTIGQPDAGTINGGGYWLTGGLWGITAMQAVDAPLLSVSRTATNTVVVSWPSPSTGFSLRHNGDLNVTNWVASPETVFNNGTNIFIIVSPPNGNRFFRLFKP